MRNQDDLRVLLERLEGHVSGERGHGERVAVYAVATGDVLGLGDQELEDLRFGGALHDIGKLGVPSNLITKAGQLDGHEVLALRNHVCMTERFLDGTPFSDLTASINSHHERWDGLGYPDGLHSDSIPLKARIIAIAETFDALTHDTRWRRPLREELALAEVRRCAGSQFDPAVAQAFFEAQRIIQPL